MEASERIADGVGTVEDHQTVNAIAGNFPGSGEGGLVGTIFHLRRSRSAVQATGLIASSKHPPLLDVNTRNPNWEHERAAEALAQVALLRDIFGNPFRPVTIDPAWRTSDVILLANGIYAERAFDRMPFLADALQDAGCDNDDILKHCRGPGPHVRGCWVVDLVLGNE